jgi:multicomponent Na+:H+ antiporter subunit D
VPWSGAASAVAPLAISVPIVVAGFLAALGRHLPRPARDLLGIATATTLVALDVALLLATGAGRVVTWAGGWTPADGVAVGVVLVADRLSAGLALLAAVLVLAVLVYSIRYFEDAGAHYHVLMLLFLSGMTGFALSGDLFDMFVFFELMGAVAYALTGFFVEEPTAVQGALNFAIINSLGAYVSLMGIGVLYARYNALGLPQLSAALSGRPADALVVAAFTLICVGFLVKAAVVPFHFWTADAEAVAPSPVCAVFSGVMVALGVYGVARVYWTVFSDVLPHQAVSRALVVLGALTAVVGAVMCFLQHHLKRLLAYSTIAHVGLFLAAVGTLDGPGTAGAAVYVLGHAGVKASLFLLAGIIFNRYGSVDEVTLHGRGRPAWLLPWFYLAAALGLAGLPPFGTGLGKAIGEESLVVAGHPFGPALFVGVSALTGAAVLRAGGRIWRGLGPVPEEPRGSGPGGQGETEDEEQREMPVEEHHVRVSLLAPIGILLAGSLAVGAVPGVARAVSSAAAGFVDRAGYVGSALQGTPGAPSQPLPEAAWTPTGVLLGLLSAVLAVAVAALALWAPRLPELLRTAARPVAAPLRMLRRVHSGHIGDYVAWLFLGTAAVGALIGLPLF